MARWSNNITINKIIDNIMILLTRRFRVIFLTHLNYTEKEKKVPLRGVIRYDGWRCRSAGWEFLDKIACALGTDWIERQQKVASWVDETLVWGSSEHYRNSARPMDSWTLNSRKEQDQHPHPTLYWLMASPMSGGFSKERKWFAKLITKIGDINILWFLWVFTQIHPLTMSVYSYNRGWHSKVQWVIWIYFYYIVTCILYRYNIILLFIATSRIL